MWLVDAVCSDPECGEELELLVEELDEVDRAVCLCEFAVVTLRIAAFEPILLPADPLPA
jgi:hypothetical protein